jgi:hypothetical protein
MIQNVAFLRKVIYLGIMAVLMLPLYMIGHPAAGDPMTKNSTPGGKLSQLRTKYDLSQAELGEIDPASESMKLATLGLRGVAANILWAKVTEYKKKENWEKMIAVVNQMAKLQPNYVTVWEFQSHNLAYNVSVEHDDYRFRYQWVKKGIEYLIKGTKYNRKEPRLFWTVGWYMGQKVGRSDETKQFRRLFQDDRDFHESLETYVSIDAARCDATGKPDNWLVAGLWFNKGYDIVETMGVPIRGKSPHIFYADGPKSRMNYAAAIEGEGILDEKAEYAWKLSGEEWTEFGNRQVPTSTGPIIRLNDRESKTSEALRLEAEVEILAPGVRDQIYQEKLASLTPAEKKLYETSLDDITTSEDYATHMIAMEKVRVSPREIAERAPAAVRARCNKLTDRIAAAQEVAEWVGKYRSNVNFEYWRTRCEVEQKPQTVKARRHIYIAGKLRDEVEVEAALREYELAWVEWAEILDDNPNLMEQLMAEDLLEDVEAYIKLLGQVEQKLSSDFVLLPLLEKNGALPESMRDTQEPTPKAPEPDPADNLKPNDTTDEGDPAVTSDPKDADVAKPDADAGKPDVDAAKPDADATKSDVDAAKPDADATKPDAEPAKPDADAATPDDPEPEADEPEAGEQP